MAKLNTWKDFKEVLFKSQDLKIEVYTSYMSLIDDFLYRVHDIDDEIESNLLKVYPVSIWMELNPRGGYIMHIESEANLFFLNWGVAEFDAVNGYSLQHYGKITKHHIEIRLEDYVISGGDQYPTIQWYGLNHVIGLQSNLYTDKEEAFTVTILRFDNVAKEFFKKLKQKTNNLIKRNKCGNNLSLCYGRYSATNNKDVANLKKIIFSSYRIYTHSFNKFHSELSKVKRKNRGKKLPFIELETIASYMNLDMFTRYNKLLHLYHHDTKIDDANESRVKYSRAILRKE